MAGAGRIPTLTSRAVALSSGGEAQTLAAQALWQLLLPAVCFTLTALLAGWQAAIDEDFASANRKPSDSERETPAAAAGGRLFGSPGEVLTLMGPPVAGNQHCLHG